MPAVSLDRAVQYHNPSERLIVALETAVNELYTVPEKSGVVDTRRVYMPIPLASVESLQSKAIDVTVVVEPFVGVDNTEIVGAVVSIRTVHVLAQAL